MLHRNISLEMAGSREKFSALFQV